MKGIFTGNGKEQDATMANKKAVTSFIWGAVAGAVAALLMAPKSGRELRKDITVTAKRVGDRTAAYGRQAGAAARSIASKTAALAADAKQAAGRLVTELRARKGAGDDTREPDTEERKAAL